MGAGFLWARRTTREQDGSRPAIPAAMVIAYGLLFVNALLLPFTLGLEVSALVMGGRGRFETAGKTHGSIKEDEDAHASQHSNTSRAI
ncbi:hypothetical protein ACTMU2_11935 [Cupriavidus basilensis]